MDISTASLDLSADIEIDLPPEIPCPNDCGYHTRNKSNMNKHVKRKHPPKAMPMTSTPIRGTNDAEHFICESCGKEFKSKYGLSLHTKNKHTSDYKYKCAICNKGYNQRIQYRFHVSSHSDVGLDKCKFCKGEFTASGSLARHLETCQSKPKPFACDICQATFSRKYKCDEHKRGKHGEKIYSCEQCGKSYGWRSSLKAHKSRCNFKTQE